MRVSRLETLTMISVLGAPLLGAEDEFVVARRVRGLRAVLVGLIEVQRSEVLIVPVRELRGEEWLLGFTRVRLARFQSGKLARALVEALWGMLQIEDLRC